MFCKENQTFLRICSGDLQNRVVRRAGLLERNDLLANNGAAELGSQFIGPERRSGIQHFTREHASFPARDRSHAQRSLARRWKRNRLP